MTDDRAGLELEAELRIGLDGREHAMTTPQIDWLDDRHRDERGRAVLDGTYLDLATAVLVAHARRADSSCLCGWGELGHSHARHVARVLRDAGALRG